MQSFLEIIDTYLTIFSQFGQADPEGRRGRRHLSESIS